MRVAGAGRRRAASAPARRAPAGALRHLPHADRPTTTAICCTSRSGGSCAPARHAGPALGRPRVPADGDAHAVAGRFDCDAEIWGRFQIPIGLAFFMRSSVTGGVVAFYPSPAGATESELEPRRVGRARASQPRARRARPRRRGADRQPASRSAPVRDRADRRVLRAGRADQVAVGGDLRRRRARARRCREFFDALRARAHGAPR